MNPIRKNIPNFITSMNLLAGVLAIIFSFNGGLNTAAWLIGIAAVLDFLDGFVARALKAYSELGKQLDSLADCVTFGVAPGLLLYNFSLQYLPCDISQGEFCVNGLASLLIPIFSAIRLAKFNIDTRQTESFIGLPTPANALVVASFPLIMSHDTFGVGGILSHHLFLGMFPIVFSYLLVAELPLFSLKFKNFGWSDNKVRYILLGLSLVFILLLQYLALPAIILSYIILSVFHNFAAGKEQNPGV